MSEHVQYEYRVVPLSRVRLADWDVRLDEPDSQLEELARSIGQHGLLNPLTVVREDDGYVVIAGRRRYRACRLLGLAEIPVHVVRLDDDQLELAALAENVDRKDMSPVEEAMFYREVLERRGWTHEELAQRLGKSRSWVTNRLRLLELDPETAAALHGGEITASHAQELLRIKDLQWRKYYLDQVRQYGFNTSGLRYMVDEYLRMASAPQPPAGVEAGADVQPVSEPARVRCWLCGGYYAVEQTRSIIVCLEDAEFVAAVAAEIRRQAAGE